MTSSLQLWKQHSLLSRIRFTLDRDVSGDSLPVLALLVAAAEQREPGSCCFVLPRNDAVANSAAVVAALSRLKKEFPQRLEEYAKRGFELGQHVCVLPTRHVYEYDGLFAGAGTLMGAPQFRLKVIDTRRRTWKSKPVQQATVRSFPVSEILRLRATDRATPLGKDNTPLGTYEESALDRLLDISSGGNTAVFGNLALLLTTVSSAASFARTVELTDGQGATAKLDDPVMWGRVTDDGRLEPGDGGSADIEPLIAVAATVEQLAAACNKAAPGTKLVIVNGLGAVTRNLQAFDAIAERQRVILVADECEEEELETLARRGSVIWHLAPEEILGDTGCNAQAHGVAFPESIRRSLFANVRRAAVNSAHLTVEPIPVSEPALDDVAEALLRAERTVNDGDREELQQLVGAGFSLLFEASSWFSKPARGDVEVFDRRMNEFQQRVRNDRQWMPAERSALLDTAGAMLRDYARDIRAGEMRFRALMTLLESRGAPPRGAIVVTHTIRAAELLRERTAGSAVSPTVIAAPLMSDEFDADLLVIASWPRASVLKRVLHFYAAPEPCLLAASYERRWLASVTTGLRHRQRRWQSDAATKAAVIGATSWEAGRSDTQDNARNIVATPPAADAAPELHRLERWTLSKRKASALAPTPESERRQARYVGFCGHTYAFVTPSRSMPVVTDILSGVSKGSAAVRMSTVDRLQVGDFVLFRDQGDHDVIELFAEQILGEARYQQLRATAERWKLALRGISESHAEVYRRLQAAGVTKHSVTVRSWLLDPDKLGPADRSDLVAIARVANDAGLSRDIDAVWNAIGELRGAHISAGQRLSDFLLDELPSRLGRIGDEETMVDLTFGRVWIVRVEEIGPSEERSYTEVNRLLWAYDAGRSPTPGSSRAVSAGGPSWPR